MEQALALLRENNIGIVTVLATGAVVAATAIIVLMLNRVLRQLIGRVEPRLHLPALASWSPDE
jgi:hypothetical protein